MMENGKRRARRQLTPEEKSVIIRLRALAKDAALAALASAKPGRVASPEQVELEAARQENDRLSEALKEMAVELTLFRGRQRSGYSARSPRA